MRGLDPPQAKVETGNRGMGSRSSIGNARVEPNDTVTVTCASCTALMHTGYPGWGGLYPPQAKVEMGNVGMDPFETGDSDSYMCLLHCTGAHWIPRMGGLYPPQAKVETGNEGMDSRSNIGNAQAQHGALQLKRKPKMDSSHSTSGTWTNTTHKV